MDYKKHGNIDELSYLIKTQKSILLEGFPGLGMISAVQKIASQLGLKLITTSYSGITECEFRNYNGQIINGQDEILKEKHTILIFNPTNSDISDAETAIRYINDRQFPDGTAVPKETTIIVPFYTGIGSSSWQESLKSNKSVAYFNWIVANN